MIRFVVWGVGVFVAGVLLTSVIRAQSSDADSRIFTSLAVVQPGSDAGDAGANHRIHANLDGNPDAKPGPDTESDPEAFDPSGFPSASLDSAEDGERPGAARPMVPAPSEGSNAKHGDSSEVSAWNLGATPSVDLPSSVKPPPAESIAAPVTDVAAPDPSAAPAPVPEASPAPTTRRTSDVSPAERWTSLGAWILAGLATLALPFIARKIR